METEHTDVQGDGSAEAGVAESHNAVSMRVLVEAKVRAGEEKKRQRARKTETTAGRLATAHTAPMAGRGRALLSALFARLAAGPQPGRRGTRVLPAVMLHCVSRAGVCPFLNWSLGRDL